MSVKSWLPTMVFACGAGALLVATVPAVADAPKSPAASASALPAPGGSVTQIVVSGGTRSLFKIAVPDWGGDSDAGKTGVETANRDFVLSSLFQVLDPKSFTANLAAEGNTIDPTSWRNVGADGVIKGFTAARGATTHVELRLFVVSRGSAEVLKREYDVPAGNVRTAVHQFVNEVIKWFTNTAGSFGTRLVFSATTGRGQKGIFSVENDGQGLQRLNAASNVALAPAIGPGGSVYYAGGQPDGSYALFRMGNPGAVIKQAGLVFGVAFSGTKMALVVSQNGQSDIWVGGADGSNLSKATGGGLNTHPAFGPGGQLAYVSNAGGNPQIFVDGKKVSSAGSYNMAPVWCNDPEGTKLLFMGRDGATWDVFSIGPDGSGMKRLTQNQGSNTYPACSPDGRMVAFFSTRGGLYTSNVAGLNQQKISTVQGESLRWEGN
ncbi:Tol-Pal system beta propeller repeat protein TolB [soil metagenome]